MQISALRRQFHSRLGRDIVRWSQKGNRRYPNFADGSSQSSVAIARRLCEILAIPETDASLDSQTAGRRFEQITRDFLEQCFTLLSHIRPGHWVYRTAQCQLSDFVQYSHLAHLKSLARQDRDLRTTLGLDYLFTPDIVIARMPLSDAEMNGEANPPLVSSHETGEPNLTPLRASNQQGPVRSLLHAVISCKWTIRSDRSQNIRAEAQTLIRNRKGHMPHIVAVVAEPLPTRIASLAYGTGDLDCVYHIALPELRQACHDCGLEDQEELLNDLISAHRLRDITDLPFDLAV